MTPCGQLTPARHPVLPLRHAGGGPGLIRRVAPTARIDPRSLTRGLKNQNISPFFFLREPNENRTTREEGSGEWTPYALRPRGTSSRAVKSRVKPERSIHLLTTPRWYASGTDAATCPRPRRPRA